MCSLLIYKILNKPHNKFLVREHNREVSNLLNHHKWLRLEKCFIKGKKVHGNTPHGRLGKINMVKIQVP